MLGSGCVVAAKFELGFPILDGGYGPLGLETVGAVLERVALVVRDFEKPVKFFYVIGEEG
jgi:hypothetical protein